MAKDANATKEMRALFFDKGFKLPEVTKDAVQALVEARGLIGNSLCGEGGSNHLEQLWCAKPQKGGDQPSFMLPLFENCMSREVDCFGSEDPTMQNCFSNLFSLLGCHGCSIIEL